MTDLEKAKIIYECELRMACAMHNVDLDDITGATDIESAEKRINEMAEIIGHNLVEVSAFIYKTGCSLDKKALCALSSHTLGVILTLKQIFKGNV